MKGRTHLVDHYREDVRKLTGLLGRDFRAWLGAESEDVTERISGEAHR